MPGTRCVVDYSSTPIAGGQPGQPGAQRTDPIPTANDGISTVPTIGHADWKTIFGYSSSTHVAMLLHEAEDNYLNMSISDAVDQLAWLKSLLDASSIQAPDDKSFAASRSRTYTLLRQLQLGLGYYGEYGNYVPLLSVDYFKTLLDSLTQYGSTIEAAFDSYSARATSAAAQMLALTSARQATDQNINKLKLHINDLIAQQAQLQRDITSALIELNGLWAQLFQADITFRNAVAAQTPGCSFVQLMTFAAAIATLVTTGGAAIAALGPAATVLEGGDVMGSDGKPITDDFKEFSAKVGAIATAGKDTGSFVTAFNTVKSQINATQDQTAALPTIPSDDAKILTTASDFDRELEPYISLPEAQAYKSLMHTFVTAAQARNNKVLELNATVTEYDNTVTTIQSLQQQDSDIDTKVAAANDPTIIEAELFMLSANRDSKARIVRTLFDLDRAIRYYSLEDSTLQVTDFSIATLNTQASALLDSYSGVREQFGLAPQRFVDKQVSLARYLTPDDLGRLKTNGTLVFTIADDEPAFENYSHVLASRIAVSFIGPAAAPKGFQAAFKHHGRSLLFDDLRQPHLFSHVTIPVSYEIGGDGAVVVDGTIAPVGGDYLGVSPYGPWSLSLLNMAPAILQNITDMVLHFDGFARSSPLQHAVHPNRLAVTKLVMSAGQHPCEHEGCQCEDYLYGGAALDFCQRDGCGHRDLEHKV